jgi:hypothetical protein
VQIHQGNKGMVGGGGGFGLYKTAHSRAYKKTTLVGGGGEGFEGAEGRLYMGEQHICIWR